MRTAKQLILTIVMLTALIFGGCATEQPDQSMGSILLATTTSTQDSGLLDVLLPEFTNETGYEVDVVAVGSGAAMEMGVNGEADVLLVHSPAAERQFIADGHATERFDVMYNDFVILGPENDPVEIGKTAGSDAALAFATLSKNEGIFVSRGDNSGTHAKELSIWKSAGIEPSGDWYVEAGQGMGAVITMANDMLAYTLSDRATWLNYAADTDLTIVTEGDPGLFNQYGVIVVDPSKNNQINGEGAIAFQDWILGETAQAIIAEYGIDKFGQPLFTPNATGTPTAG